MKLIDIDTLCQMISRIGLNNFYLQLIQTLENDFSRWHTFYKSPRHATHYSHGVIELMPCSNDEFYSFKYVNGHPDNTRDNKLCVVAMGLLSEVASGYPLMISEMTLLTALRTAATAALAARYLARKDSQLLAIIGTGAQAEFQAHAFMAQFPIQQISYFDIDPLAMDKFEKNMRPALAKHSDALLRCDTIAAAVRAADIIVTATAAKKRLELFTAEQIKPGTHIHAMGGDCPGKTEFSPAILKHCKVVVEYTPQSRAEGEIQQGEEALIDAELWEIITGKKPGRENNSEITFFDSVGFALEDFSILKLVYQLAQEMKLGKDINLIPNLDNAKNLFSLIQGHTK